MIDIDELMRLHAAATPGPWEVNIGDFESEDGYGTVTAPYVEADGKTICVPFDRDPEDENDESDAAYIVAACNAVPELVARIRELEEYKASVYAAMCNESLDVDGVCPMSGMACPFEKECEDITTDEWLAVWRKNA